MPQAPINWTTEVFYRGKNVVVLLDEQDSAGYPTAEWSGFRQALRAGFPVRKDERGTQLLRVIMLTDDKGRPLLDREGEQKRAIKKLYVFNRAQLQAEATQ